MLATPAVYEGRQRALDEVRELYDRQYPTREAGVFSNYDWERCRVAFEYITGPRVLEVGVGPGQMFNALSRTPEIEELVGVDIRWNKKLLRPDRGDLRLMNILRLDLQDRSFDSVLCMEVLEHLEAIDFPKGLAELRRVCRGTLVMTVPYEEPEPVWHHDRPGGHRQSFSEEKIERFFPRAERRLVYRGKGKWKWIMLIERFAS